MPIFSPIPMPMNAMDAFNQGLQNSQNIFNSLVRNRQVAAQAAAQEAKNPYIGPQAAADLQNQQNINKEYIPNIESEIGLRGAQTTYQNALARGVPSEIALRMAQASEQQQNAQKQKTLNEFLPQREQAEIGEIGSRAKYYAQGGGRAGVPNATEQAFQNSVLADNPQITDPDKQRELINAVARGDKNLSDGTPINPMSEITQRAYNRSLKTTTTAQQLNQNLQANQAAAELPIFDKYINEGVHDTGYGTTIFGKSPQQIKDSLDTNNHDAQERLGKYIAAQQLLYDKAALMLKINALPPGVKLANEIRKLSSQSIDAKFPTQSAESRKIAAERVAKALNEGLEARNKYGVGASGAFNKGSQTNLSDPLGIR